MNNDYKNENGEAPGKTPIGAAGELFPNIPMRSDGDAAKQEVQAADEADFVRTAEKMFAEAEKNAEEARADKPDAAAETAVSAKAPGISITMEPMPPAEEPKPENAPADKPKEDNPPSDKPTEPPKGCAAPGAPCEAENTPPVTHLSDREVMAHTASIWQYREVVNDGTEQHSEFHEKRLETAFAEVIGARVRGKKHKHEGTNCDDFFETAASDDCIICVVCDGAGSKPLSRIGSRISSETAAAFLKEKLAELFVIAPELKPSLSGDMSAPEFMDGCMKIAKLVQESARQAYAAQKAKLAELAADETYKNSLGRLPVISDLSATFLAAVIVPLEVEGKRQSFMATVQIGDGCICAIDTTADAEHCFKLMGAADSGKFSGETDFLSEKNTQPDALATRTRVSRGGSDIFLLMTDGVADDYFPAQPMMKRLYLDLCLNGILPMEGELTVGEDPAPVFYASVSPSRQSVALQYAKQLLSEGSEAEMNALWDKRGALRCHSLEAFRMNIGDSPEERMRVWLDNYNERGSFDDRTLTAVRLK